MAQWVIESASGFLLERFLLIYCVATDNQLISFCLPYSLCYYFCAGIIIPHKPFPLSLIKKALLGQVRGLGGSFHDLGLPLPWPGQGFSAAGAVAGCGKGCFARMADDHCKPGVAPSTENFGLQVTPATLGEQQTLQILVEVIQNELALVESCCGHVCFQLSVWVEISISFSVPLLVPQFYAASSGIALQVIPNATGLKGMCVPRGLMNINIIPNLLESSKWNCAQFWACIDQKIFLYSI